MAPPPIYDGAMATCEGFINSCHLYITAKLQEFPNLQVKITWVLGFMQMGMAQLFQDHFLMYMTTPEYQTQYLQSSEPDQIELLYHDIYKAFGDPNKQATAIQEVTTIKQGSKTGKERIQLFKQCYRQSGYGKITGIHEFKQSLNTPLLDKCMAVPDLPVTLEKWYSGTTLLSSLIDNGGRLLQRGKCLLRMEVVALVHRLTPRNWTPPVNHPQQQQQWRSLVPAAPVTTADRQAIWLDSMDADRDELWWMVTVAGSQAGGSVARIKEVLVATPATSTAAVQPPATSYAPSGFQFGQ
ncbi:hypothetical protein AMATHDRAFT_7801 [Amanita thiersii Skay4041]|uniref:Uncharacterized protein n=1 Tax=Amanita thiersii Skay4041 TaxID=703135 RepID=A0A2A9NFE9_9AGAR|nr:hypothetical protein AMATHDRAFT_7801 [Amanita thiersii Skay4041]